MRNASALRRGRPLNRRVLLLFVTGGGLDARENAPAASVGRHPRALSRFPFESGSPDRGRPAGYFFASGYCTRGFRFSITARASKAFGSSCGLAPFCIRISAEAS